jgi:hypothetical protein
MRVLKLNNLARFLAAFSLFGVDTVFAGIGTAQGPPNGSGASEVSVQEKEKEKKKDDRKSEKKGDPGDGNGKGAPRKDNEPGGAQTAGTPVECTIKRTSAGLAAVAEASDVAASRRSPGILWSHGDSYVGEPVLFAFDANGAAKGKVRLQGLKVADWEAIAVAPCGGSNCLYVGDIGDNRVARKSITVHRLPEPLPTDQTATSKEAFHATFPDGPHDAEAMFVSSSGEIFIVTKGETGPIALYRFGASPKAGGTTVLQKVAVLQSGAIAKNQWVTGASASPDGKWIAMRTHGAAYFYDAERLLKGDAKGPLKYDATSLREPQGEGIAFGPDGAVFLAGEGGGKGTPGTLSSGVCKLPAGGAQATP